MSDSYRDNQGVFHNKLGITDAVQLEKIEYEITGRRAREWESKPYNKPKEFGLDHQKAIHKHLFGDVYEWAGEIRTVPSRKTNPQTGGVSQFADPDRIEQGWNVLDKKIIQYLQNDQNNFQENLDQLTQIFVEANKIHPFPEGNGRSLQVFMRDLAKEQEIDLDYSKVSNNEWNRASASSGIHGRLFERQYFIPAPSDDRQIKEIFNRIASPSQKLTINPELFTSHDVDRQVVSPEKPRPEKGVNIIHKSIGEKMVPTEYASAVTKLGNQGATTIELPQAHTNYAGKVIQVSDTHIVQRIDEGRAVAHDVSKLTNKQEILTMAHAGAVSGKHFDFKYSEKQGVASVSLVQPVKSSPAIIAAAPARVTPTNDLKR